MASGYDTLRLVVHLSAGAAATGTYLVRARSPAGLQDSVKAIVDAT
jgi:hypothetical protein